MPQSALIVSVTPQRSPTAIHKDWAPFLAALEQITPLRLQLRAHDNKQIFDTELSAGIPDLAYLNPEAMVEARRKHGYIPLVRDRQLLTGILLVLKDSPIQQVSELNGRTLSFPWETAFASSIYMHALLRDKEKIAFTATYAGNHQNVYRHLLLGEAAAGSSVPNILAKEPEAVRARLRVIYTTPGMAPHALAVHPRVPAAQREQLTQATLRLAQSAEGRAVLNAINIPTPLVADYLRDYSWAEKYLPQAHGRTQKKP